VASSANETITGTSYTVTDKSTSRGGLADRCRPHLFISARPCYNSGGLTVTEFIAKWRRVDLTERSASQQHFLDLCALVGQEPPAAAA